MNLKYYLRGLGIGIAMTAIILGVGRGKETLSDAEIKQRAAQLGMVEQSGLLSEREESKATEATEPIKTPSEKPEEPKPTETPKATEKPETTETPEETEAPEATETPKPTETPSEEPQEPKATEKPTATPEPIATETPSEEQKETSAEVCKISVHSGDGSLTVCKRLEEAGLIASASAFDLYMNEKGYDKKLQVGTFEISMGTEPEEIALILMKKR